MKMHSPAMGQAKSWILLFAVCYSFYFYITTVHSHKPFPSRSLQPKPQNNCRRTTWIICENRPRARRQRSQNTRSNHRDNENDCDFICCLLNFLWIPSAPDRGTVYNDSFGSVFHELEKSVISCSHGSWVIQTLIQNNLWRIINPVLITACYSDRESSSLTSYSFPCFAFLLSCFGV